MSDPLIYKTFVQYIGEVHGIDDQDIAAENEYWDDIISKTTDEDHYINLPVKSNIYREVMDRQRRVNPDDIKLPFTDHKNTPYTEEQSLKDSTEPSLATKFALDKALSAYWISSSVRQKSEQDAKSPHAS